MNVKEIKQILGLINENEVAEFELEREGVKLSIKKYPSPSISTSTPLISSTPTIIQPEQVVQTSGSNVVAENNDIKKEDDNCKYITSPIVGTFYAAPSPDSDDYVKTGSKVNSNDTVCIVEAMKVMNEIKAELSGTIEEVLVENGQAVEFGQQLFKVKI